MNRLPTLVFILLITSCIGNKKVSLSNDEVYNSDSFKKYSYALLMVSAAEQGAGGGTAFFVRRNDKLFLVTAKHVLTGCDSVSGLKNQPYNSFYILIEDSTGLLRDMVPINFAKIKDTATCNDPDIIALPLAFDDKRIYSIERFLHPPFEEVENVDLYGFPAFGYKGSIDGAFNYKGASHIRVTKANKKFYSNLIDRNSTNIDPFTFFVQGEDSIPADLDGYSGSPVFVKDAKSSMWRVAGAFVAAAGDTVNKKRNLLITDIKFAIGQIK